MQAKRALIIHPNNDYNCGDQITFLGTKALLTKALGGSQNLDVVQFDIVRAERELDTYVSQFCWGGIDIVALAGSPWLWVGLESSSKYRLIYDALKRFPDAKKVALGIGSCVDEVVYTGMTTGPDRWFYNTSARKDAIRDVFGQFDCVFTRDLFAQYLLELGGISSRLAYDTSAYAEYFIGSRENHGDKKLLWFYDPSKGVSANNLSFDSEEYIDYQLAWAKENDADIYCNSDCDMSTLMERGVDGIFSVDLFHLSAKMTEYNEMLSGRIHMGVLGFMSNIPKITVLPVDSRFLTILRFGIDVHFIGKQWSYEKTESVRNIRNDIAQEEKTIVLELQNALR